MKVSYLSDSVARCDRVTPASRRDMPRCKHAGKTNNIILFVNASDTFLSVAARSHQILSGIGRYNHVGKSEIQLTNQIGLFQSTAADDK